jgi:hypothetical protein
MYNKLSDQHILELATATEEMDKVQDKIFDLQNEMNEQIEQLNQQIQNYNNMLKNVNGVRRAVITSIDDFVEGQSDAWKASPDAEAYKNWRECWADLDTMPLDSVSSFELEDMGHAQTINEVPTSLEP